MYLGYLNYVMVLCLISGVLILLSDTKAYKHAELNKEQKVSKFLGWSSIAMGIALMVGSWLWQYIFW